LVTTNNEPAEEAASELKLTWTPSGKAHIPSHLRKELGYKPGEPGEVKVFLNANFFIMAKDGATEEEILKGLDVIRDHLLLKWGRAKEVK